jgi:hypothetical protein
MSRFQVAVLVLMMTIVLELGIIAVKLPASPTWAQGRDAPIPVVLIDPGMFDCPTFRKCAKVDVGGALRVSIYR